MVRWSSLLCAWWLAQAAPWTEENAPWNLNFETRHEPDLYYGQWPGHTYNPSPPDWRSLVIYQLLTDRFADGNPQNNELFEDGFDVRDMTFRHGGDFEGLRRRLYYIRGLGCNAIWISPIFQNGYNFYHQYAQLDFTVLDKRLGTLDKLRHLVADAHELGIYVIVDVVMNHMANEFYFEGHSKSQAPWRFHEDDGNREYKLKVRTSKATFFNSSIWCGGDPLWQEFGNSPTGLLLNSDACEERCAEDPDCFYFLWKDDLGSLSTYHCAGFKYCDSPTPYTDGKGSIFKKWTWPVVAEEFAQNVWCGGSGLWSVYGGNATGLLTDQDTCEARCASDDACQYYLWKDDPGADTRFHCAGFSSCSEQSPFGDGSVTIFKKRSKAQRDMDGLYHTPAGRQPYADFWYNNTWDPTAQYNGTVYGQWGESKTDTGFGTYIGSDFHHNGDLQEYYDPWEINLGKIYGVMDDLRLENERVQQKYIAMTKALITSTDVDGFRVDTPMQVPLNFYKVWAPAMRAHAQTLGKDRFGIFGEFFVSVQRYGTMTGRGRDNTMYNQDIFIDDIFTLKGGIVYPYYWYIFTAMVYKLPEYVDGLPLAYVEENKIIDTLDPATQRHEYAMWTFCNNHDNWRLQSMTGFPEFHMCLALITFWPGVPLHYAGDEQDFDSPGSALDGWAREELSPSLAWRAVRTQPNGNPADGDNFDMTSSTYLYIKRLNALRRAYFGEFGNEECDQIQTPTYKTPDVLVFIRGCSADKKVLLVANFHTSEQRLASIDAVPWSSGTVLTDCLVMQNAVQVSVEQSSVSITLAPLQVLVLSPAVESVPAAVVEVWPKHGSSLNGDLGQIILRIKFDRSMADSISNYVLLNGEASSFQCSGDECTKQVDMSSLSDGHHSLEVTKDALDQDGLAVGAAFRSEFMIDRQDGVIANSIQKLPGLICDNGAQICHKATGASWFRVQNVGSNWSEWRQYNESTTKWNAQFSVPVLVQYYSRLSASFIVGDCLAKTGERCHASWHEEMFLRGEFNDWGKHNEGRMMLISSFTWGINVSLSGFVRTRFTPVKDWSKSYGSHPVRELLYNVPDFDPRHQDFNVVPTLSGSEPCRKWMTDRELWSERESIASGAEFATDLWLSHLCTAASPQCVPDATAQWQCHGYTDGQDGAWCASVGTENCWEYGVNDQSEEMSSCGPCYCCRRKVKTAPTGTESTCCVKFNDLFLNYTVTSDLSQCAPSAAPPHHVSTSFTMRIQVGTPSNLEQISVESYKSSVIAALDSVTASVTVAKVSYMVLSTYQLSAVPSELEIVKSEICSLFAAADSCVVRTQTITGGRRLQGLATIQADAEVETSTLSSVSSLANLADDATALQAQLGSNPDVDSSTSLIISQPATTEMKLVTDVTTEEPVAPAVLIPETSTVQTALESSTGVSISVSLATTTTTPTTTTQGLPSTSLTTAAQTSVASTQTSALPAGTCMEVVVRSAGGADGNYADFSMNGQQVELSSGRGFSIVILTEDGGVQSKHVYDTGFEGEGSGPLASLLNGLPDGTAVLIAAMDDASDSLTPEARSSIQMLGATKISSLSYRDSYALIGIKGQSAIAEAHSSAGEGPIELKSNAVWMSSCQASTSAATGGSGAPLALRVKSAGGADGNFAEFYVNGALIDMESARGLSVVVLGETGAIVSKQVFDTGYEAEGAGPLVDLLESLADGTIVMIAAMDDASDSLTAEAKAAIAALGATKVDQISYRSSYALIGVKGRTAIAEEVAAPGEGSLIIEENLTFPLSFSSLSSTSPGASSSEAAQTSSTGLVVDGTTFSTSQQASSSEIGWSFEFIDGCVGYANVFRNALALALLCMM